MRRPACNRFRRMNVRKRGADWVVGRGLTSPSPAARERGWGEGVKGESTSPTRPRLPSSALRAPSPALREKGVPWLVLVMLHGVPPDRPFVFAMRRQRIPPDVSVALAARRWEGLVARLPSRLAAHCLLPDGTKQRGDLKEERRAWSPAHKKLRAQGRAYGNDGLQAAQRRRWKKANEAFALERSTRGRRGSTPRRLRP